MAYKRNDKNQIVILVTDNIHNLLLKEGKLLGIPKTQVINKIINEYYKEDLKKLHDKED